MMRGSRAWHMLCCGKPSHQSDFILESVLSLSCQLAPLSLHDVVQVTVVPVMQAWHTSTH
jgi:hypothetical protein